MDTWQNRYTAPLSWPGQRGSVAIACLFTQQEIPLPLHPLIIPAAKQILLLTHTDTKCHCPSIYKQHCWDKQLYYWDDLDSLVVVFLHVFLSRAPRFFIYILLTLPLHFFLFFFLPLSSSLVSVALSDFPWACVWACLSDTCSTLYMMYRNVSKCVYVCVWMSKASSAVLKDLKECVSPCSHF